MSKYYKPFLFFSINMIFMSIWANVHAHYLRVCKHYFQLKYSVLISKKARNLMFMSMWSSVHTYYLPKVSPSYLQKGFHLHNHLVLRQTVIGLQLTMNLLGLYSIVLFPCKLKTAKLICVFVNSFTYILYTCNIYCLDIHKTIRICLACL